MMIINCCMVAGAPAHFNPCAMRDTQCSNLTEAYLQLVCQSVSRHTVDDAICHALGTLSKGGVNLSRTTCSVMHNMQTAGLLACAEVGYQPPTCVHCRSLNVCHVCSELAYAAARPCLALISLLLLLQLLLLQACSA
jgi:hypothetical protein